MPLFVQRNGLIKTGNSLGSNQGCCCDIVCTATGASSGGEGVTVNTYAFPSSEQQVFFTWEAFTLPDKFTVKACGTTLFTTGTAVSGNGSECFSKQAGCDEIEITVEGDDEGTVWFYAFQCQCPPPPPPRPCCSIAATCGDQTFWTCSGSEAKCCADLDPEADCSGETPPITECEPNDTASVPDRPPFDCLGTTHLDYLNGAWVQVSSWDVFDFYGNPDPGDFDPWFLTMIEHAEDLINGDFFAEWDDSCFATTGLNGWEIDLGDGPTVTDDQLGTIDSHWTVRIYLNMCERSVQLIFSGTSTNNQVLTIVQFTISAYLGPLNGDYVQPPCNAYDGCYCTAWSEALTVNGGGLVSVGFNLST